MITKIINGKVSLPDCSGFLEKDVYIKDGIITDERTAPDEVIDANGGLVIPGFVDIHTHGALGFYYFNKEGVEKVLALEVGCGVTTVLPTLCNIPIEPLKDTVRYLAGLKNTTELGSVIGGIHIEGPFLSQEKKGAINVLDIECTVEGFMELYNACEGNLKVMTIAPERENALEVIKKGAELGVRMSIGHSMATFSEAVSAIDAGAVGATHTFNAMRSYDHREPGILGAVLTDERISCEAICDLIHLAPATVKLIFKAKGADKFIAISDSSFLSYLEDGVYYLDGRERRVGGGVIRLASGTISGSCSTLADNARKLLNEGYALEDIVKITSLNPAKAVGLDKEIGSIEPGKRADILITDERLNVKVVLKNGKSMPLVTPLYVND